VFSLQYYLLGYHIVEEIDIKKALEILELPHFITKQDIKNKYYSLAKKYHPDITKDSKKMNQINNAYEILMDYIENYKYSFDDDEISKQLPNITHNQNFKM